MIPRAKQDPTVVPPPAQQRAPRWSPWRKRIALGLLGVVLAVAGAGFAVQRRATHFKAAAQLVVTPLSRDNDTLVGLPLLRDLGDPIRTIETAATVVESPRVAALAADRVGGTWTARKVQDAVAVRPLAQTNVLEISATTTSAEDAAVVANAYAAAVLSLRRSDLVLALQAEIAATTTQLSDRTLGVTTANSLRERISELRLLATSGDPTIGLAQQASPPLTSSDTPRWAVIAFAGLAALVLEGAVLLLLNAPRSATAPALAPVAPSRSRELSATR
jgi:hypothetical protein